jgi:hypothetical protein
MKKINVLISLFILSLFLFSSIFITTVSAVAPTVTTQDATGVTSSNATLHGTLTNNGSKNCNVGFEYGLTVAYGNTIYPDSVGSGSSQYFYVGGTNETVGKFSVSTMAKVSQTGKYGGTIYGIAEDNTYLYVGGLTTAKLFTYWKSNMTKKGETTSYGVGIKAVCVDSQYAYVGGAMIPAPAYAGNIKKYDKNTLAYISASDTLDGTVNGIIEDTDYLYAFGSHTIYKILKTDLSTVDTYSLGSDYTYTICQDSTHLYIIINPWLGVTASYINKVLKSDMSYVASSPAYGTDFDALVGLTIDDTYIFASGEANRVKKYLKSDMSYVSQSSYFPNDLWYIISDDNYLYITLDSTTGLMEKMLKSTLTNMSTGTYSYRIGAMSIMPSYYVTGDTFYSNLGGLLPDRTYHFRSWATNSDGTSYGADKEFTTLASGVTEGCTDFTNYDTVNHVDHDLDFSTYFLANPFIEMVSYSPLSAKLMGWELLVGEYQQIYDPTLSNYDLYVNGNYVGNPVCFKTFTLGTDAIQWDLTSYNITISNEVPIFEVYHSVKLNPSYSNFYWHLQTTNNEDKGIPALNGVFGMWSTSHINGKFDYDDITRFYTPNWILYYTNFASNGTNPNYSNGIGLLNPSGDCLPINMTSGNRFGYVYNTIYLDVYNDGLQDYFVSIYTDGDYTGATQFYPKVMSTYHRVYGFTPYDSGEYTANIEYVDIDGNTQVVADVVFDVFDLDVPYALWTFPNPSNTNGDINIGVYAKNPERYSYYSIGVYADIEDTNLLENANMRIDIPEFTDYIYFITTSIPANHGTFYLKLFATNSTALYNPMTGTYRHFIESSITSAYIRTDLTDGVGVINVPFIVSGSFSMPIVKTMIFMNDEEVYSFDTGDFNFEYEFSKEGTYTFYLKSYVNCFEWITLDKVSVQITGYSNIDEDEDTLFPDLGNYNIIVAVIIIAVCTLLPLIVGIAMSRYTSISVLNIPALVYVAFFLIGVIVTIGIGYLPTWSIFFVLFSMILAFAIVWFQRKIAE